MSFVRDKSCTVYSVGEFSQLHSSIIIGFVCLGFWVIQSLCLYTSISWYGTPWLRNLCLDPWISWFRISRHRLRNTLSWLRQREYKKPLGATHAQKAIDVPIDHSPSQNNQDAPTSSVENIQMDHNRTAFQQALSCEWPQLLCLFSEQHWHYFHPMGSYLLLQRLRRTSWNPDCSPWSLYLSSVPQSGHFTTKNLFRIKLLFDSHF